MNAFLWAIGIVAGLNTLCVMFALFTHGQLPKADGSIRFLDAIVTACFGVWALCLLFR